VAVGESRLKHFDAGTQQAGSEARPLRWRGPGGLVIADVVFAVACLLAVALLVYLGRYSTFIGDEWSFIVHRRGWSLDSLMAPHNEHWTLTLALVYKALFATIGLRSYLPYLVVLMVTHVAAASAVYVLMRHHNGQLPALAGGILMLFLGTGADNLFWAFQVGFVGAAAAGAWAIALLLTRGSRRAELAAAALLLVAVASSGVGLSFLVATGAMLAIDPVSRRRLWVVVPASVAYLGWYLTYGSTAIGVNRDPFTLAGLQQVPTYLVTGVANAIGKVTGWGEQVGLVLFVVLSVATAWQISGTRRLRGAVIAGFVGLVALFALAGLVRAQLGSSQATSSRYVYIAAVLLLIATAGWVGSRSAELRVRPLAVLGAILVVALGTNLAALPPARDAYRLVADSARATIIVTDRYGGSPAVSADADIFPMPDKRLLDEIRDELGLPLDDAMLPDPPPPDPSIIDARLYLLAADAFAIGTATEMPTTVIEPEVAAHTDVSVTRASSCIELHVVGSDPQVVLRVRGGDALAIEAQQFGEAQAFLALNAPPAEINSKRFAVAPGSVRLLRVPDVNEARPWIVRVDPPAEGGTTRICIVAGSDG